MKMEDFDWTEMWNKLMEESYWGQRAGTPEFWDERVDWFKENDALWLKHKLRTAMIWWRKDVVKV